MSQEKTNNNLNHHSSLNDNILADNTKKKLPERKNRGLRMKFLEGKDPSYPYDTDVVEFGDSLSFILTCHMTRPEIPGLTQTRL